MKKLLLSLLCIVAVAGPGNTLKQIITIAGSSNQDYIKQSLPKYIAIEDIAADIVGRRLWLKSSLSEKKDFARYLGNKLVDNYASTISNLSRYNFSYISRESSKRQVLRIFNPNGSTSTLVVFFRKKGAGWQVIDSSFNGISLVSQWRAKLMDRISQNGLNGAFNE